MVRRDAAAVRLQEELERRAHAVVALGATKAHVANAPWMAWLAAKKERCDCIHSVIYSSLAPSSQACL